MQVCKMGSGEEKEMTRCPNPKCGKMYVRNYPNCPNCSTPIPRKEVLEV